MNFQIKKKPNTKWKIHYFAIIYFFIIIVVNDHLGAGQNCLSKSKLHIKNFPSNSDVEVHSKYFGMECSKSMALPINLDLKVKRRNYVERPFRMRTIKALHS